MCVLWITVTGPLRGHSDLSIGKQPTHKEPLSLCEPLSIWVNAEVYNLLLVLLSLHCCYIFNVSRCHIKKSYLVKVCFINEKASAHGKGWHNALPMIGCGQMGYSWLTKDVMCLNNHGQVIG